MKRISEPSTVSPVFSRFDVLIGSNDDYIDDMTVILSIDPKNGDVPIFSTWIHSSPQIQLTQPINLSPSAHRALQQTDSSSPQVSTENGSETCPDLHDRNDGAHAILSMEAFAPFRINFPVFRVITVLLGINLLEIASEPLADMRGLGGLAVAESTVSQDLAGDGQQDDREVQLQHDSAASASQTSEGCDEVLVLR